MIRDCKGSRERAQVVALAMVEAIGAPALKLAWQEIAETIPTVSVDYPADWPHVKQPADFSACLSNPSWGA